jgi:DnaK suppressor protein
MATKKKAAKTKSKKKTVAKKPIATKKAVVKKKAPVKKAPAKKTTVKKKTAANKAPSKKATAKKMPATTKNKSMKTKTKRSAPAKVTALSTAGPVQGIKPYALKKNEEYMNPEQVQHFKNILLAWKRDLIQEVDRTVHHMQDEAANFPDPNDRATQESEFSMELRARDRERKLIKKIDESLIMLESDEYGYCDACGLEIGIRRLEARPTATQCIDCKTLDEIREKQMG